MTEHLRYLYRRLLPYWRQNRTPDPNHPHRRRFTNRYRRKRDLVKNLWIGSGLLMVLCNNVALILVLALATTFLSFCVLDETA